MGGPLHHEVLVLQSDMGQAPLPLAADGVQRYVWESRFGAILIEVIGEEAFVNGDRVEPAQSDIVSSVAR
jgi:hypothetical protein